MKTDDQRLQLALDFVNGPDVKDANLGELRENLAKFLGHSLLADGENIRDPDVVKRKVDEAWPDNIGGTGFEVDAHIDVTGISMSKGYEARDALASFIGFGPKQEEVPFDVLRKLQNRTRQLIHRHLGSSDTVLYANELAEQLGDRTGSAITVVGRDGDIRAHITAEPAVAFQWIVLLLINGQPDLRACAHSKCEKPFVKARTTKLYCSDGCGAAARTARQYADPKKRAAKIKYIREKRARERR